MNFNVIEVAGIDRAGGVGIVPGAASRENSVFDFWVWPVWKLNSLEFGLKNGVPSVHSVDLVLVLALTRALGQVALGPLSEAGCDLLDAHYWVLTVVSINI